MDLLSLRDLPLAFAFGIACLWFYNQANVEFGKKYVALIETFGKEYKVLVDKYDGLVDSMSEERRQWVMDQRTDRAELLKVIRDHTAESMAMRNAMAPFTRNPKPRGTTPDERN